MDEETLIWRPIPDFPNYEISSEGDVRNVLTGRPMSVNSNQWGVLKLNLRHEGRTITRSLGRLVAEVFLDPPKIEGWNVVVHEDGDLQNCRAGNLFWARRWFAISYHDQFKNSHWYKLKGRVRHRQSGMTYLSPREAAIAHHVLAYDVYRSAEYNEPTRMFHHEFSWVDKEGGEA